jgi:hypothetical protein
LPGGKAAYKRIDAGAGHADADFNRIAGFEMKTKIEIKADIRREFAKKIECWPVRRIGEIEILEWHAQIEHEFPAGTYTEAFGPTEELARMNLLDDLMQGLI